MPTHRTDHAKVFALARKHLPMDSTANARTCLADAIRLSSYADTEHRERAVLCAIKSLAYSIGILHADYTRAFNASGITGPVRLVS